MRLILKTQYERIFSKILNSTKILIPFLVYTTTATLLLMPLLFYYLNSIQVHYYIDEKFHIPQTIQYCNGQFDKWDPKITTLPGLYVAAALVFGPLKKCTITYLRSINLWCIYLNLILNLTLITTLCQRQKKKVSDRLGSYRLYLVAWNITFFPPLFFWFFLYYTDILSVTLILIMFILHVHNKIKTAAIVGVFSIFVRQTNVIWIGFVTIEKGLSLIEEITKKPSFTNTLNIFPCIKTLYKIFQAKAKEGLVPFLKFIDSVSKTIYPYIIVLVLFIIFVICNGSIVVGDKTAHVPTIHITQVLYCSIFIFSFSWPYFLPYTIEFLQFVFRNIIISIFLACLVTLIVYSNSLVHPYMLADNRHYTFYIWKNFMNQYFFFKYLLVPVYIFAIYAIFQSLNHLKLLMVVAYMICVCIVLVPQLLLEVRYFIIPYIVFRLYQKEPDNWQIIGETITTCLINFLQFFIFINKSFSWSDEEYPQRIGW